MINTDQRPQTSLQYTLYTGILLIVVSTLFLSRQQSSSSFIVQALTAFAAPSFFYGAGALVIRYLRAPLAGPGMIATGAWLVVVAFVHLLTKLPLLPEAIQPHYWLIASLIGSTLITLTGHRVHLWLLVLLVPLTQVNLMWAMMSSLGVDVRWMPSLSFLLVILWWEIPLKDERWVSAYRVSGVFLTVFLLIFSLWLLDSSGLARATTWIAGAIMVAILGARHGWARTGPLAIAMLVVASMWGLPSIWWPVAWIVLAAATVIFIERLETREQHGKDAKAVEISEALAVVLCGFASLLSIGGPRIGVWMSPVIAVFVVAAAGFLFVWLGWRQGLRIGTHVGLWLLAAAWMQFYWIALPQSPLFGLWLVLFASTALLIERVLTSRRKQKRKAPITLVETVIQWPFADLVIGLSTITLLWNAQYLSDIPASITAVTLSVAIGVWIVAGLVYRLPVLLHVALCVSPIPVALLLLIANPAIWTLPLMGIAWQVQGFAFLMFGHSVPRYRPVILAPFFVVGYGLLGIGLVIAGGNGALTPASLGLVVVACAATSAAVIGGAHPSWTALVERLVPSETRPYAFKNIHHLFLFLTSWLSIIWLQLMMGHTGMPFARMGIFYVVFACLWFLIGRLLARLPGVVGWPVTSAGWMLWLIGLLIVFYSPTEAIVVMILGLALSGEGVVRSRSIHWVPVFILQLFFSAVELARMLSVPSHTLLLLVTVGSSMVGMLLERTNLRIGRTAALTGGLFAICTAALRPDGLSYPALALLAAFGAYHYRDWRWIWGVYISLFLGSSHSRGASIGIGWEAMLIAGTVQWVIGAEIARVLRKRTYQRLSRLLLKGDWATPFLWVGGLQMAYAVWLAFLRYSTGTQTIFALLFVAAVATVYSIRLRAWLLPYVAITCLNAALLLCVPHIMNIVPNWYSHDRIPFDVVTIGVVLIAIGLRFGIGSALRTPYPFVGARWLVWWLRPLLLTSMLMSGLSVVLVLMTNWLIYASNPLISVVNALALATYMGLTYRQTRRQGWLWAALCMVFYAWIAVAGGFYINDWRWYTLPVGLVLLFVARRFPVSRYRGVEAAGTIVLLLGSAYYARIHDLFEPGTLICIAHAGALVAYGYFGGRRIPFAIAGAFLISGTLWKAIKVNVWLVPLMGGVLLISCTLFVEVQHNLAERWTNLWVTRWQQWK